MESAMTQLGMLVIVEVEPQPKTMQEAINAMKSRMDRAQERMCIPIIFWMGMHESEAGST
jgi:hypothetical protein